MADPFAPSPIQLPSGLSGYSVLSALSSSDQRINYLAQNDTTGQKVVIKLALSPADAEQLRNEQDMLNTIRASNAPQAGSFPAPISCAEYATDHGPVTALVRSFIPGKSVESVVESAPNRPGLSRSQALDVAIGVAELLCFLHSLPQPIIHRDIKPQNVILDSLGRCHLIDLGISRVYRSGAPTDTRVMGTQLTAPPEQFGYQQTDSRSDVYSTGVLLRYCLTGEYTDSVDGELDSDIRAIVTKATMFDPRQRYQSAGDMLTDLVAARYQGITLKKPLSKATRRKIWLAAAAMLVLVLAGVGLYFSLRTPPDSTVYTFHEPLIEQAVRQVLAVPDGDVTYGDLKQVTAIHIMGQQVYESETDLWFQGASVWMYDDETRETGLYLQEGSITSLTDITAMPNLTELCLHRQRIADISVLRGTHIARLGLGYNPLTDLTPLSGNEHILSLNISGLPVDSVGVICTLPNLQSLCIGASSIRSLVGLEALPLTELNLCNVNLDNWTELNRLASLTTLSVNGLTWDKIYAAQNLPIRRLTALNSDQITLSDLGAFPLLEELDYRVVAPETVPATPLNMPHMKVLTIGGGDVVHLASFTCLSSMTDLRQLYLLSVTVDDLSGLDSLNQLSVILCSQELADRLQEHYPNAKWAYIT